MRRFSGLMPLSLVALECTAACASQRTLVSPAASVAAPAAQPSGAAASSPVSSSFNRPASQDPSQAGADPDGQQDLSVGAAVYLERALDALRDEQPAYATASLRAALATGDLNDAGRALTYWYLYVAEETQGNRRASNEALNDFVVIAETVLLQHESDRVAHGGGSEFIERFDLPGRVARGRAILNLAWAEGHLQFGRSIQEPVPVQSDAEIAYFVELAPACAKPLERREIQSHPMTNGQHPVQQVDFRCRSEAAWTTFYFETKSP